MVMKVIVPPTTPHTFVPVSGLSFIQQISTENLLCTSIFLDADIKLSCKEINNTMQLVLMAMKYSGDKSLEGALQVETDKSLVLCETGQRWLQLGSRREITEPLQFHLTVFTTKFHQNVYSTSSFAKNINPYPALSQQPFLKPALLLPVCLSRQQSELQRVAICE